VRRSRRYHANIGGTCAIDVTDLMAKLQVEKDKGTPIGLVPVLIKATAKVMKRHPKLNRQFFQGLVRRYEVQFNEANCATIVRRTTPDGQDVLINVTFLRADEMDVRDIAKKIRHCQTAPLEQIPEYQLMSRLLKMPSALRAWFSFKARSDHKFIAKNIPATYGLSSFAGGSRVAFTPTQTISPYCATFFPSSVTDRPWVVDGQIQVRKILEINMTLDHYLIDGGDGVTALSQLAEILSRPEMLGL
jgi:pyruvate/2-oxoglutarate dehydrogenase complex dihydrolipoamide acyltransferase (E2) component